MRCISCKIPYHSQSGCLVCRIKEKNCASLLKKMRQDYFILPQAKNKKKKIHDVWIVEQYFNVILLQRLKMHQMKRHVKLDSKNCINNNLIWA